MGTRSGWMRRRCGLQLAVPNAERIFYLAQAFQDGMTIDEVYELTKIDRWFLHNIRQIVEEAEACKSGAVVAQASCLWGHRASRPVIREPLMRYPSYRTRCPVAPQSRRPCYRQRSFAPSIRRKRCRYRIGISPLATKVLRISLPFAWPMQCRLRCCGSGREELERMAEISPGTLGCSDETRVPAALSRGSGTMARSRTWSSACSRQPSVSRRCSRSVSSISMASDTLLDAGSSCQTTSTHWLNRWNGNSLSDILHSWKSFTVETRQPHC